MCIKWCYLVHADRVPLSGQMKGNLFENNTERILMNFETTISIRRRGHCGHEFHSRWSRSTRKITFQWVATHSSQLHCWRFKAFKYILIVSCSITQKRTAMHEVQNPEVVAIFKCLSQRLNQNDLVKNFTNFVVVGPRFHCLVWSTTAMT